MESWFERNIELLSERQPAQAEALRLFPPRALHPAGSGFEFPAPAGSVRLAPGPNGEPYLKLTGEGGERRLSSALNPRAEDRAMVDRFFGAGAPAPPGLTVLGLGLAYHLEYLAETLPPEAPILAIEARAELASAALTARDLSKVLSRPNFTLSVGPTRRLPADAPRAVLARPANLRQDPGLYPAQDPAPAGRRLKPPRILFLDADYFLGREIQRAARLMGSPLSAWSAKLGPTADGSDYRRLLAQIKDFRPEMVLTVNHLGFDADGILASALRRLGLPMASWFVDSPYFILAEAKRPDGDFFAFCWDSDYLGVLRGLGYGPVTYLPLATDPAVFSPAPAKTRDIVAFVGDSLAAATEKYLALSGLARGDLPAVDALAGEFLKSPRLTPGPDFGPDFGPLAENLDFGQRLNLAALITWRASRLSRLAVLSAMPSDILEINGDPGWREPLPAVTVHDRLNYYADLAPRYRSSAINLNVTSAQMKTGLNQRVFDVPACRAFLLTDSRAQLQPLFDPDEVATYGEPAEAADLARFYLARPDLRERMAAKAHARVLASHLYTHRLEKLTKTVMGHTP
ncbi:MAG: glycosyltransferase [Deltaproteobacteria bacterium]|jgi:spore maturation protein CgeB|nr:glycosyltransferase [Deltaproteobacteria bacterium]